MCTAPQREHSRGKAALARARAHQGVQACAVEVHFGTEVNECAVNSSEIAAHGCGRHRSDTQRKHTARTASVTTLLGGKV